MSFRSAHFITSALITVHSRDGGFRRSAPRRVAIRFQAFLRRHRSAAPFGAPRDRSMSPPPNPNHRWLRHAPYRFSLQGRSLRGKTFLCRSSQATHPNASRCAQRATPQHSSIRFISSQASHKPLRPAYSPLRATFRLNAIQRWQFVSVLRGSVRVDAFHIVSIPIRLRSSQAPHRSIRHATRLSNPLHFISSQASRLAADRFSAALFSLWQLASSQAALLSSLRHHAGQTPAPQRNYPRPDRNVRMGLLLKGWHHAKQKRLS
jgi:hypothetical protein